MHALESTPVDLTDPHNPLQSSKAWSTVDNGIVLLLLALFAGMVFIINPQGEFPLNDDWAYILPVEWLVKQGKLRFTDWQFMTLIGQVYLGAATATVSGFSITGLRLLVFSLAALSVVLVYLIARLALAPRQWALAAAGLLICNPVFLITSASFMTDTPFLAVCLLSILFFLLWQKESSILYGLLSWLLVFYACSIRQSGVALAIGFSCFLTLRVGFRRELLLAALLPTLLTVVFLATYPMLVERSIGLPSMYNLPAQEAKAFVLGIFHAKFGYIWMAAKTSLTALFYLGLFLIPMLPITLSMGRRPMQVSSSRSILIMIALAFLVTAYLATAGHATPVTGNTLFDFGLGIRTLQNDGPFKTAPPQTWWVIAFLATLGVFNAMRVAWFLLADARASGFRARLRSFHAAYAAMLLAVLIIYNLPFLARGGIWFDRYALPNLAFFGLLAAPFMTPSVPSRKGWAVALILMGASLIFAVLGTHDYLEWNRKRWEAANDLARTDAIGFNQIDAGFEYNNYRPRQLGDHRRVPDQVLLNNPGAEYRIAFSPLPRHNVLKVIECHTWLYGSPSKLFVLRSEAKPAVELTKYR